MRNDHERPFICLQELFQPVPDLAARLADTIREVADAVGYGYAKNFTTAFKKRYGYDLAPAKTEYVRADVFMERRY